MAENDGLEMAGSFSTPPEERPLVEKDAIEEQPPPSNRTQLAICFSHALSTWSERTWAFAVGLIFIEIYTSSLFYVSLSGLVQALVSALLSPSVGVFIDNTPRLRAVCTFYLVQNIGLVLAALSCLVLLDAGASGVARTCASLGIVAFGALSTVGSMGGTIAIEKDWSKALMGSNSRELAELNSTLKAIDLVCLIVAPVFSGFLMHVFSMRAAVIAIFVYNLVAWFPEVALVQHATSHAPQLQKPRPRTYADEAVDAAPFGARICKYARSLVEGLQLYFQQPCVLASLALSILHFTVLSFGILMTAYVKWLGLSEVGLSLYCGLGALMGVLGAKSFPSIHSKFGLRASGFLAVSFFLVCVLLAALPDLCNIVLPVSTTIRFSFLVWAVAISRFGLWVFDLAVSQILQEWVEDGKLGRVCATQRLLEHAFTFLIFVGGILVPNPEQFVRLMLVSVASVISSFVLFALFFMRSHRIPPANPQDIELIMDASGTL